MRPVPERLVGVKPPGILAASSKGRAPVVETGFTDNGPNCLEYWAMVASSMPFRRIESMPACVNATPAMGKTERLPTPVLATWVA